MIINLLPVPLCIIPFRNVRYNGRFIVLDENQVTVTFPAPEVPAECMGHRDLLSDDPVPLFHRPAYRGVTGLPPYDVHLRTRYVVTQDVVDTARSKGRMCLDLLVPGCPVYNAKGHIVGYTDLEVPRPL